MIPADDELEREPLSEPVLPDGTSLFDSIGEQFGEEVASSISSAWSVVCRAAASDTFDVTPAECDEMLSVFITPEEHLTDEEIVELKLFSSELGKARSPSRAFENLTAVEFSLAKLLRRGARRKLNDLEADE